MISKELILVTKKKLTKPHFQMLNLVIKSKGFSQINYKNVA